MRRPGCAAVAAKHSLPIVSTAQIAAYRREHQGGVSPPMRVPAVRPAAVEPLLGAAADRRHMARALALAARGEHSAAPNPWVGCVLVGPDGDVLGEGFHRRAGLPHAEVEALADAARRGNSTVGATAFVTLEPCHHTGRTG